MWLWTLSTGAAVTNGVSESEEADDDPTGDAEGDDDGKALTGFVLEFDAARKIAQGLGAHIEQLADVVEVKGKQARLLPVSERAKRLFARHDKADRLAGSHAKDSKKQLGLFAEMEAVEREAFLGDAAIPTIGETTLDRVHQAMILFGMGRSEALRRFVVEDGVGKDERFWKLADSLSKLYPPSASEKRWVDGVLARKKSLGF
jgi:putative DNA methylase